MVARRDLRDAGRMDDIDERIAFGRLTGPLLDRLDLNDDARAAVLDALWRERASLSRWLLLTDGCGAADGPPSAH